MIAPLDDPDALGRACDGQEILFHLAGAVDFGNDWERCRAVNVGGTRNVLAAARGAGVRRVVHASSIVAIGAARRSGKLNETAVWNLGRLCVPYVTTKREAEELALAQTGDPEVVVVNPGSVVGPDDFSGSEFGTLCRRFWLGRIPFVFGGGNNFVDVRDVADGILRAGLFGRPGERYILGGENRTYANFFTALAQAANQRIFRLRLPTFVARMMAWVGDLVARPKPRPLLTRSQARLLGWFFWYDSTKARAELGYRARPLKETLADAYDFWMKRCTS
jgi:dihydroflavonol-4-reductase